MIRSFVDVRLEQIFEGNAVAGLADDLQQVVLRKLLVLNAAVGVDDLAASRPDAFHRALSGPAAVCLLRVDGPIHLRFQWVSGHAYGVELCQPH